MDLPAECRKVCVHAFTQTVFPACEVARTTSFTVRAVMVTNTVGFKCRHVLCALSTGSLRDANHYMIRMLTPQNGLQS